MGIQLQQLWEQGCSKNGNKGAVISYLNFINLRILAFKLKSQSPGRKKERTYYYVSPDSFTSQARGLFHSTDSRLSSD